MHLFSPLRPEASPGVKALLGDGSAVPNLPSCCRERSGWNEMQWELEQQEQTR